MNTSYSTTPRTSSPSADISFFTPRSHNSHRDCNNEVEVSPQEEQFTSINKSYQETQNFHHEEISSPSTSSPQSQKGCQAPTAFVQPQHSTKKPKESHKMIEKKYRNRLNGYFGRLFAAVTKTPPPDELNGKRSDRRVSKGKVLVLAIDHIRALEMQCESLEKERKNLLDDIQRLRCRWGGEMSYGAYP